MNATARSATASAPATVGNAAVGFDRLGFALEAARDRVTVRPREQPVVSIDAMTGVTTELPAEPEANTATAGMMHMIEDLGLDVGFTVEIDKGIPLGSGMGGSAASAVAGVVAACSLIEASLSESLIMSYALKGEAVASGGRHGDNVAPALTGGLALVRNLDPPSIVPIPVPDAITCVLVHPHLTLETRRARSVVPAAFPLSQYVDQSARLGGLIAGCYRDDLELIEESLEDVLIEPHRAALVPGFDSVQSAALEAGALGCSLSGAGPSLFAWCDSDESAERVRDAMVRTFAAEDLETDAWIAPVSSQGAELVSSPNFTS